MILYFSSKLIRALAFVLVFKWHSAKDEMRDFWTIESSLGDVF
jgi:hypothetical protein